MRIDPHAQTARDTAEAIGRSPAEAGTLRLASDLTRLRGRIGPDYLPSTWADRNALVTLRDRWSIQEENYSAHMADVARTLVQIASEQMRAAARKCRGPYTDPVVFKVNRDSAFEDADMARACLSVLHRLTDFCQWVQAVRDELRGHELSDFDPATHTRYVGYAAIAFLLGHSADSYAERIRDHVADNTDDRPPILCGEHDGDPEADQT